jgi:DNA-binding NarL/FixJ family response regulator
MNIASDRKLTVAVCDSQPLIVEGLRSLLANTSYYRLLEPVRSLEMLTHTLVTLSPRVALVDKGLGTQDVLNWLGRNGGRNQTPIIVWGALISDAEALRFLQNGAKGVLRKTALPEHLMSCLDAVVNGATWMDDNLFRAGSSSDGSYRPDLTPREQQVLVLVQQGLRNKEIAHELGISPGTVKIHLKHIFEKSGVRGRYGLALSSLADRVEVSALSA